MTKKEKKFFCHKHRLSTSAALVSGRHDTQHNDTWPNDVQNNCTKQLTIFYGEAHFLLLRWCRYAEYQYAECCYAGCRYAECRYAECRRRRRRRSRRRRRLCFKRRILETKKEFFF
jgi:hypothetical protein